MNAKLSCCFLSLLPHLVHAQIFPAVLFQAGFGGTGGEALNALAPADDGGILLGGWSSSQVNGNKTAPNQNLDGSNPRSDFWVVKIGPQGIKQWDRTFGGVENDELTAMLPTSDGGFLLGGWS